MLGFNTDYLNIGISVVLHDEFTKTADNFSKKVREMYQTASENINQYHNTVQTMLDGVNNLANAAISQIVYAVKDGADFIDTMTMVGATARATDAELASLTKQAQSLGYETMLESKDIASGMKYLAMAGNNAKEIQEVIGSAANLAIAGQFNLGGKGGAADLLTNILHTFSLEGEQAAKTLTDQLVMAANSANTSVEDLAVAIKYASADMVSLGQTAPEVAAAIGILGNRGIQASMAGTALSNFGRYLNRALGSGKNKFSGALAELGLSRKDIVDAQGNLLPMLDILEKLRVGMDKIYAEGGEQKRNEVLNALFGVRGFRAGLALIDNVDEYRELLNQIYNSEGYAASISQKRMDNLAGSINKLNSALENIRTSFAKSIEPVLKPILNTIAGLLDSVSGVLQGPMGKTVATITLLVVSVGKLASTYFKYFWMWKAWQITMRTSLNKTRWSLNLLNGELRESNILLNANTAAAARNGIVTGASNIGPKGATTLGMLAGWGNRKARKSIVGSADSMKQWMMDNPGTRINGVMYDGKSWSQAKPGQGSKFISGSTVIGTINSDKKAFSKALNRHLKGLSQNTSRLGRLSNSLKSWGSRIGGGFTSMAGSFLKASAWGLAISGAIALASEAISTAMVRVQEHNEELKKNTLAINTLAGQYASEQERRKNMRSMNMTEELRALVNALYVVNGSIRGFRPANIIINGKDVSSYDEGGVDSNDTGTNTGH